ncbi:NCS2 family permease [Methanocella arvoryzae]|uniref:Permease (Xanthine/uracil/vitamin C family) n=1 Tax=Methanocella arvoryzae (strain DSM 22066 / NBRC 105507 / MRE50) TaxID=351160 RepID=Q0W2R5_METAR|nr:NCS2 family permease [Methanocella arvoryzae]CAJ37328.1 putative permease (xanthine/uracil/vitamin C family) [Methanocella arvoryzae MRE50]
MYQQKTPKDSGKPGSIVSIVDNYFQISERKSTIKTELLAGLTTFMTMAYIIILNPIILSAAGMDFTMVFVGTCVAAAVATLLMGFVAKYPFALASGMGLNSVLTYGVVIGLGLSWQTAMLMIVIEGALITLLVLTNLREMVMDAIPKSLKLAIGAAIGLFIAYIGFMDAKIMVGNSATLIAFGSLYDPMVIMAFVTLLIIIALMAFKVKGSILYGIILSTILGLVLCVAGNAMGIAFNMYNIEGVPNTIQALPAGMSNIPAGLTGQIFAIPTLESFGMFFGAFSPIAFQGLSIAIIPIIFAFLMVDFFDTMGTVVAVGEQGRMLDKKGKLPGLKNVLLVDSVAAMIGGAFGASSVTTYVESASGVAQGGRTGLTAVTVAILFLAALFFVPLAYFVPMAAAAPALIIVGYLMITSIKDIAWDKIEDALPAFLTIVGMVFTFSISKGIGFGFISYCLIKVMSGKWKDVHPLMWIVSVIFLLYFIFVSNVI